MNRRQKIIVSVTGIFIVLLALVGLTYAYFLTRIQGNTSDKSISVTTANLALVYRDGSPELITSETPIVPGKFKESKTFTVTNEGNATVDSYGVYLEDFSVTYANDGVDNNGQPVTKDQTTSFNSPTDMKMTITCKSVNSETGVENGTCDGVDGTLPTGNATLLTNSIDVGIRHEYTLTLEYVETGVDQSADMNKTVNGKIQIYNEQDVVNIEGSVTGANAGDYVQINSVQKISQIVNGNYVLTGVEPGEHTLAVYSKDKVLRGSTTLTINKGNTNNVNGSTITITDKVESTTADITAIDDANKTITISINEKITDTKDTLRNTILANGATLKTYKIVGREDCVSGGSSNEECISWGVVEYIEDEISNSKNIKSTDTFKTTDLSIENSGLFETTDDYGTSYYFKGAILNNYVSFAGLPWRIVRINGDDSVRLVLDGITSKVTDSEGNTAGSDSAFNTLNSDNAHIGYMYGTENSDTYDLTHAYDISKKNTDDLTGQSTIKLAVDAFYEKYLKNSYSNYLSDTLFCGDKILKSGSGVKKESSNYTVGMIITSDSPILAGNFKCAEGANNNYSRYTVNATEKTNGWLTYPIGMLSVNEIYSAGIYNDVSNGGKKANKFTYINNDNTIGNSKYWTMTPLLSNNGSNFLVGSGDGIASDQGNSVSSSLGVRPVINIRKEVLVDDGIGTKEDPYLLTLPN